MATSERLFLPWSRERLFLPWSRETIFKHSPALARLLEHSFQPGTPETALDYPSLTATHASLLECSPCKICQLVYSLASDPDCAVGFFEDYACLCFYCLYAPLTWTSTFMAAADFLELTARYHPGAVGGAGGERSPPFYGPEGIMAVDVQLHFLIKKCFRPVAASELLGVSNLHFLKSEFLKGALTGSLCGLFCFKSVWGSLHGASLRQQASLPSPSPSPASASGGGSHVGGGGGGFGGQCRCCNPPLAPASSSRSAKKKKQQQGQRQQAASGGHEGANSACAGDFAGAFAPGREGARQKPEILSVFLDAWAPSDLLSEAHRELAAAADTGSSPPPQIPSRAAGALSLHTPRPRTRARGPACSRTRSSSRGATGPPRCACCASAWPGTGSECLAGHGEAAGALARLRGDVLTFVENNVRLVDRIAFVKRQPDFLVYVRDPLLRDVVRGCSEQEIHKHLFCDPLCALNAASACPDVLFGVPEEEKFKILKSSLALGHHLAENVFLDCEVLHTLVIIFKSIQLCKVGKTTFLEIIKELNQQLKSHNLHTLHTFHTATIYC
nr:DNA packaging protein UL32 [Equid gammaherpesvirus 5]